MIPPRLTWTKIITSQSPPARELAASVVYQDQLYIHGGSSKSGVLDDFWSYNFITKTFQQVKVLSSIKPCARAGHAIVVYEKENAIYLFGGTPNCHTSDNGLNDLWKYDIHTKNWIEINQGKCPSKRYDFVSFVYDEKLYVLGGYFKECNGRFKYADQNCKVHTFDFEYQTWSEIEKNNDVFFCGRGVAWFKCGNNLYLFGGHDCRSSGKLNLDDFQWKTLDSITFHPPAGFGQFIHVDDNYLYLFGGYNINYDMGFGNRSYKYSVCRGVLCYNADNKIWIAIDSKDFPFRSRCVSQVYKKDLYVFGGSACHDSNQLNHELQNTAINSTNDLYHLQITYNADHAGRVINDLRALINNPDTADVCFVIEEKQIFANKCILSVRSEFFKQLIAAAMESEQFNNFIKIDDGTSHATFSKIIEFLYTGKIDNLNVDVIMDLLVAAEKYSINDLKTVCSEATRNVEITTKTAIDILLASNKYKVKELKEAAMQFIIQNWNDANIKMNINQIDDVELFKELFLRKQ